jgi:hypothetical protein
MTSAKPVKLCKKFQKLDILTVPYGCIFSLVNFIVSNSDNFQTQPCIMLTSEIRTVPVDQLPISSCFQKGAYCAGLKIFMLLVV